MLESLKKEAKRWLKALPANDSAALARFTGARASAGSADTARRADWPSHANEGS
jgi:hypothetical protein